jgi:hypothetical protein
VTRIGDEATRLPDVLGRNHARTGRRNSDHSVWARREKLKLLIAAKPLNLFNAQEAADRLGVSLSMVYRDLTAVREEVPREAVEHIAAKLLLNLQRVEMVVSQSISELTNPKDGVKDYRLILAAAKEYRENTQAQLEGLVKLGLIDTKESVPIFAAEETTNDGVTHRIMAVAPRLTREEQQRLIADFQRRAGTPIIETTATVKKTEEGDDDDA